MIDLTEVPTLHDLHDLVSHLLANALDLTGLLKFEAWFSQLQGVKRPTAAIFILISNLSG